MEAIMDLGGINIFFIEVVGAVILFAVMLWAVMRTRSKGKESSTERTERATHELYKEEERRRKDGVDNL
jgi:lysylphosphatidylglycerol synthetase-like protein (DUF2156 family)